MMQSFLFIFIHIILPIFIQISSGYLIQKKFSLNIGSLSKIQFFIFLPSLLFVKIYETTLGKEIVTTVILHSLGIFVLLFFISWLLVRVSKHSTSVSKAFINSICFYNGGNYCLPIIQLLYNSSLAISIQVIIIMVQNILSNTVGIFNASSGKSDKRQALLNILKLPILYAIFLAIIMKLLGLKPWGPLWNSVNLLGQGMVPLALVILGAQLASTSFSFKNKKIYLSNTIRLVISPALSYILTLILGVNGVLAQVLIIASAAPTAVNTLLLSIEFDNEPELASHIVFSSTVFSAITMTIVIFLVTNFV